MKIDRNSLANLLRSVRAATIVAVAARTEPAMHKTENPYFGRVWKIARLTAVIGGRYSSAVNRRRITETSLAGGGDVEKFRAERRAWGEPLDVKPKPRTRRKPRTVYRTPLIQHNGRLYLNLQRQQVLEVQYRDQQTGREIPAEKLEPYLLARTDEAARQGLRNPVIVRDYALENLLELRMRGNVYVISDNRNEQRRAA